MRELLQKYRHIILYGLFGVFTTIVNVTVYHVCFRIFEISNVGATVIAWIAAVTLAFLTNKSLVFGSHSWNSGVVLREALKFFGCRIGTGILEVGLMFIFVDCLGRNGTIMKMMTNVIVIILNYIFSKLFIFNRKHEKD